MVVAVAAAAAVVTTLCGNPFLLIFSIIIFIFQFRSFCLPPVCACVCVCEREFVHRKTTNQPTEQRGKENAREYRMSGNKTTAKKEYAQTSFGLFRDDKMNDIVVVVVVIIGCIRDFSRHCERAVVPLIADRRCRTNEFINKPQQQQIMISIDASLPFTELT